MGRLHGEEVAAALREAPFDSTNWSRALEATARACGAASAQLLSFGPCRFTPIVAPGFNEDDIAAFVALEGADPAVNHGLRAVLSSPLHAIVTDAEYLAERQRSRDRLYNEFFRRFDGHYVASGTVARNAAAVCNINLFLPARSGGLDIRARRTLRDVLPHFTRAVHLATRMQVHAAALACEAWDSVGDAVMVCDADGTLLHASRSAERLLARHGASALSGHWMTGFDAVTMAKFKAALCAIADPATPALQPFTMDSTHVGRMVVEVVPLPLSSFRTVPAALILLSELDRAPTLDRIRLGAMFALTPAECDIAEGVMQRLTSADIARLRGVSINTVHTQVKALLAKTGVADRGKLTLLLQGFTHRHRQ
jgi:DNA-binding CsgD family transcriptional regulator